MPTVSNGEKFTLEWISKFADSAKWMEESMNKGSVELSGSNEFTIPINASSGIWSQGVLFTNKEGVVACIVTAKVVRSINASFSQGYRALDSNIDYPVPSCTITADKSTIQKGDTVVITWSSTNADYGTWSDNIKNFLQVASKNLQMFNMVVLSI